MRYDWKAREISMQSRRTRVAYKVMSRLEILLGSHRIDTSRACSRRWCR